MMQTGLVFDEWFKQHDTGRGHPERPARLDAIQAGLESAGLVSECPRVAPQPADLSLITRVHTHAYVERLRAACEQHSPFIDDPESAICPESFDIALRAAGAVTEAARCVAAGHLRRAFCAVRPPGHHAEADRSMGFCLFNNVAVAARGLREEFGLERVLILDWDVHHGNGTQHLLETDPSVLFISLHGHPDHLYPGTGYEWETGRDAGEGFTLNVPFLPGAGDAEYRSAFERLIEPAAERYEPQFVLISAGFDAHADDPLGNLNLSDEAFAWMTRRMIALADRFAGGRIVSVLEGGYNLDVLRRCVAEHVRILCEE